ncbi:MAG: hypothetical protein LBS90_05985 [Oscillospiraceae bacterium]|jgi:hypothetical protein|nr:hypothetical protein [Oscillospiraceae bacterium]
MRVFLYELRKIWNLKAVLIISALGALAYFALSYGLIASYNEGHYSTGYYVSEMFRRYGATLDAEEYADFDFAGRKAELEREITELIAEYPVFAEYGVETLEDYERVSGEIWEEHTVRNPDGSGYLPDPWISELQEMSFLINDLNGPYFKLMNLTTVEEYYNPLDKEYAVSWYVSPESENGNSYRPAQLRRAEAFAARPEVDLIPYNLTTTFSAFAMVVLIFSVGASVILAAPAVVTDRQRKVFALQYSSQKGRRVFTAQTAAALFSAFALTLALVAASYAAFLTQTDASDYLGVRITSTLMSFYMWDFTLLQYFLLLAGMTVSVAAGAAGLAFVLARHSNSVVTLMLKAAPAAAGCAALGALAVNYATSNWNYVFGEIFNGKRDLPEVWVCAALAVAGLIPAVVTAVRERRLDV